ncbi:MAG TPA: Crp/Fnr family transcriptional regulator [Puia sp.]|jgi:CRP-like cAMP-binding protein|nr:Crp/Fnr family transcriptional regulator [Puia sp.]
MFEKFKENFPQLKDKWDEYTSYYKRIEVPAKFVLLKEGEISKKAYLIEKGCLRVWFNHNGKDITFQFFFENEGVSSAESFRKNIPSYFTIETIEPCILHWIHKKDIDRIIKQTNEIPELRENMMNILFERQLHYMKHFLSFIKDTPTQRYLNLVKEYPKIVQRVPQQYIASYLGITPVSLSRIRNRATK